MTVRSSLVRGRELRGPRITWSCQNQFFCSRKNVIASDNKQHFLEALSQNSLMKMNRGLDFARNEHSSLKSSETQFGGSK